MSQKTGKKVLKKTSGITPEFTKSVEEFIKEYRSVLEDPYLTTLIPSINVQTVNFLSKKYKSTKSFGSLQS